MLPDVGEQRLRSPMTWIDRAPRSTQRSPLGIRVNTTSQIRWRIGRVNAYPNVATTSIKGTLYVSSQPPSLVPALPG